MAWTVMVGEEFDQCITFNFSPLYRTMMPGGLSQLHGVTAEEAAVIIWHGFRSVSSMRDEEYVISLVGTGPFVRGMNTVDQGLRILRELWEACIKADPKEKVIVFG